MLIWLFGTLTASLAAYLAAYEHDMQDRQAARGIHGAGGMSPAEIEEATLDASTAIGFLLMASVFLLILYFLLKAGFNVVLVLLNCVFLIAATSAVSTVMLRPFLLNMKPNLDTTSYTVRIPKFLRPLLDGLESFELPPSQLLSMILSFIFALCWFTNRKGAWMWLLQDVLSMSVCLLFVRTLRLPSLRIGTVSSASCSVMTSSWSSSRL